MTHAKTSGPIGMWPVIKPKQRWPLGKKRGPNINRRYAVPQSPYAAGTHRKLLDRYLRILTFFEKRVADQAGPITTVALGEHMGLMPAVAGITCDHLANYLTKHGLEPRKMLQRSIMRGVGISWEGRTDIATGLDLIRRHMRQVPK